MRIVKRPFNEVRQFSSRDIAYTTQDASLSPFYKYEPSIAGFKEAIADRAKTSVDRSLLTSVLRNQYATRANASQAQKQINLLDDQNTFTVITAHQPALFTGPLYYIYKIACTIQLSRKLKNAFPDKNFIPVFVSGGEDHDFEEINHFRIFNKELKWEQEKEGAVGRLQTDSLQNVIAELSDILGDRPTALQITKIINQSYAPGKSYGKATLDFVHQLFGNEGLVVVSMDDEKLKNAFKEVIAKEVIDQPSEALVGETQARIAQSGFKDQAFARPINFFYLGDGYRERIEVDAQGKFQVLNSDVSFTKAEILNEISEHPERFSPNVVMRPIYQEFTFPNLAYIGGGGELAYWLERKTQFEHFNIFYPMLVRRNSALWVDKGSLKKMDKLDISIDDLFQPKNDLIKQFVAANSSGDLSYVEEKNLIADALSSLVVKAKKIDPTLAKSLDAEATKTLKNVDQLGSRLIRAEKQKQEKEINQISALQEKLFPDDSLQERKDNFLALYLSQGDQLIPQLIEALNPLDNRMVILLEE